LLSADKQTATSSLRSWLCSGVLLPVRLVPSTPTRQLSRGSLPLSTFSVGHPLSLFGLPYSRTVPPSGFAYPHGGFSNPSPRPVYFNETALIGFHPPEASPSADPARLSTCPYPLNVICLRLCSCPHGPRHHRFLGLPPGESPLTRENTIKCHPCSLLP
jgi:hypothetical protein